MLLKLSVLVLAVSSLSYGVLIGFELLANIQSHAALSLLFAINRIVFSFTLASVMFLLFRRMSSAEVGKDSI